MTNKRDHLQKENAPDADQPLDQVLAEFIRRRDAGQPVDVESLCAARPDLADALRSYADGEDLIREMALDDSVAGASALAETIRPGAGRDTNTEMTGRVFGNYRVIRQLGQGGMGAVYLAEDLTLQRQVALKIPKFRHSDGPDARERFFREARAAAALNHPHICPVFHADEVDGTPYIAMAFIDGQPLSRFVGTDEFHDSRRVVEVVRAVADALQHAHDQGVIHRDLKPGNVMLDRTGRPIVTDFGLARRIVANQESRITQEGQLLGTPAYMSPEQIAGNPDQVSSSTDIYALGVVLFELLTSRLPFQGSVPEVIAGALKIEPPKPSSLRADVDPVLESLCLQMLQKKPEHRPASMQNVSERLQQWLDQMTPESAADQTAAKKLRKELVAERERIGKLIRAGKFEAALRRLQLLARRKEPAANEFREWAIDQIPRVKARPAQAKRNEPEMLKMAQEWMAKHDYQQAIQILQSIPDLYRSETAEELLLEATELQEEADDLLLDLKKCVKDRIYDGIDDNLKRLLVLKPGNQFAKNLQRKLLSYRGGRGKDRPYRFDKQGRLLAVNEDNFWSRAMILSAVVGVAVFGLMTWAITIYLRNGDQQIAVEIDPDWLQEQGGELILAIDGTEHMLSAPSLNLEVALGEHGFTVRHGDTVVHDPQRFSIEKEGRQIIHIDAKGMSVGWAPPTKDPSPNISADGGPSPPYLTTGKIVSSLAPKKQLRAGIIGLDTSHCAACARFINADMQDDSVAGVRMVAAYPRGSLDIPSSLARVPDQIAEMRKLNVEIVDSIDELLSKVDMVFLLTNDGRPHFEQYVPVAKARKPCFIDKPLAASLADAIAIFELAKRYDAPVFSSSSLRFDPDSLAVREGSIGKVIRCEATSPAMLEPHHPDLFWYGIHGVETLFTVLGTGCESVTRRTTANGRIEVVGTWSGNRVGVFRQDNVYSGTATSSAGPSAVGSSTGFEPLVSAVVEFARSGISPVSEAETLEIYAFMEAADESNRRNGIAVSLNSVLTKARAEAAIKVAEQADGGQSPPYGTVVIPFPSEARFVNARGLAELNTVTASTAVTNAYPWISSDGLTIWWTREGPQFDAEGIYQARRQTPSLPFSGIRLILPASRLAGLSADGLEIVATFDADGDGKKNDLGSSQRVNSDSLFPPLKRNPDFDQIQNPKGSAFSADGLSLYVLSSGLANSVENRIIVLSRTSTFASWQFPRTVNISGNVPVRSWTWPSLTPDGNHLLLGYFRENASEEWPAVADATTDPLRFTNARPILIDGQPINTRAIRYCSATGELFFTRPLGTAAPFKGWELWVANVPK